LSEAVRCRVPADGPIGAYVSGGLDSSSVACMAAELRDQGAIHDAPIIALSMTARVPRADERRYVDAVVRQWRMTPYQVDPSPPPPDVFADQARRFLGLPEYPNIVANADLARAAHDAGCRVLLSGLGGDDWLTACYFHCAELLARGRIGDCLRQLRVEREAEGGGSLWWTALRRGVWPLLPVRVRCAVSRARGRTGVPDHIAPELARRTSLADRMQPRSPNGRRCRSRTQQELYDYYWSGDVPYGFEDQDRHHAWFGLEVRHPFHDRRIIEFLLAVPEEQRWRGAHTKVILRKAMGPLLPDELRLRLTKSDYTHTFMAALEACGGERCFARLETAERGWIRPDTVRALYRDARARHVAGDWLYSHSMYKLWTVYALELWLKYAVA
jgi:asparagine synthase (glutamine-hydrolysing)